MKKSYSRYTLLIVLFQAFFFASCKKFVQTERPKTQIDAGEVFTSDASALSAVSGLYSNMMSSSLTIADGGMSVYMGLAADEIYNTASNADYDQFLTNSVSASNGTVYSRFWVHSYQRLYHANSILEGIQPSTGMSTKIKRQVEGEVKFARAFYYFYLVNLYGDVPLVLTTDYEANAMLARTPSDKVVEQVVKDLQDAEGLLADGYASTGRVRPNRQAATALLARVYLYEKDWVKAEAEATKVIQSGIYSLMSTGSISSVFQASSGEAIWQLMRENSNTSEGSLFIPSSPSLIPGFALTSGLLDSFEPGDLRKSNWTGKNRVNSMDYYYPFKYKVRSSTPVTEYEMVLRFAEQFLIRAEARAWQGKISEAQDDLNKIRNRAGLANTAADTPADLLSAVQAERRHELFAEWGHRWLDLKRTGKADAVLDVLKAPNWQMTDTLLPLPQTELDRNPFLVQNPGY
jgi:hypothetical protein